jgi:hypothetical protein
VIRKSDVCGRKMWLILSYNFDILQDTLKKSTKNLIWNNDDVCDQVLNPDSIK